MNSSRKHMEAVSRLRILKKAWELDQRQGLSQHIESLQKRRKTPQRKLFSPADIKKAQRCGEKRRSRLQDAVLCRLSHQLPQPGGVLHFTSHLQDSALLENQSASSRLKHA